MAHLLTLLRLALVLPFALLLQREGASAAAAAGGLLLVAIATDLLDGPVARRRGTAGPRGRVFDHAADFLFVCAGLVALAQRGVVPWLLPLLVAVAFAQYVLDSAFAHRARQLRMSALGRWNGILYFVPLVGDVAVRLLLAPLAPCLPWLGWGLVVTTLASILDRLLALRRPPRTARD